MNSPSLDDLVDKVDSKYLLVVAAAKRARQIMEERADFEEEAHEKPVTQALKELAAGRLTYELVGDTEK